MDNEKTQGMGGAENPAAEAAPCWTGDELDEIPAPRNSGRRDRIIGMSEGEMRNAGAIFAIIVLLCAASGFFLSQFSSERARLDLVSCGHIARNADRLSCYDKAASSAAAPFRGTAPFSTLSRPDADTPG